MCTRSSTVLGQNESKVRQSPGPSSTQGRPTRYHGPSHVAPAPGVPKQGQIRPSFKTILTQIFPILRPFQKVMQPEVETGIEDALRPGIELPKGCQMSLVTREVTAL